MLNNCICKNCNILLADSHWCLIELHPPLPIPAKISKYLDNFTVKGIILMLKTLAFQKYEPFYITMRNSETSSLELPVIMIEWSMRLALYRDSEKPLKGIHWRAVEALVICLWGTFWSFQQSEIMTIFIISLLPLYYQFRIGFIEVFSCPCKWLIPSHSWPYTSIS